MTLEQLTNREYAYLNVRGVGRHETVTELVGRAPSEAHSEDEINPATGKAYGAMSWRLNSGLDDKQPLSRHVDEVLLWLTRFPGNARRLAEDYELTLHCVGWYPGSGHGAHLTREHTRVLGQLGVAIDLDFYFLDDHGHSPRT
jgi:hypothetical protein